MRNVFILKGWNPPSMRAWSAVIVWCEEVTSDNKRVRTALGTFPDAELASIFVNALPESYTLCEDPKLRHQAAMHYFLEN